MKNKFHHAKSLGQNFLVDDNIVDAIIKGSDIGKNDLIIEIGPGSGVLTEEIAKKATKVVAIEIDDRLIPILNKKLSKYDNLEIIHKDIMKCDVNAIIDKYLPVNCDKVRIIGNLPYYITTPIVMKLLEERAKASSITIMIQKEVADRIAADPGTKDCGAITASVAYFCSVKKIVEAPKEAFYPRPKVDSAVLRLDVREKPPVELKEESSYFEVVKYGFSKRRKTLLNALTGLRNMDKIAVSEILERAGIDPKRRAETLNIQEISDVANALTYERPL